MHALIGALHLLMIMRVTSQNSASLPTTPRYLASIRTRSTEISVLAWMVGLRRMVSGKKYEKYNFYYNPTLRRTVW